MQGYKSKEVTLVIQDQCCHTELKDSSCLQTGAVKMLKQTFGSHLAGSPFPEHLATAPWCTTGSWEPTTIHLWSLRLVLLRAPVNIRGFQRNLVLLACLQLPSGNLNGYTVQRVQHNWAKVTSIRALSCLPQLWPHLPHEEDRQQSPGAHSGSRMEPGTRAILTLLSKARAYTSRLEVRKFISK